MGCHGPKKVLLFDDNLESMRGVKLYLEEEVGWDVTITAEKSILDRLRTERFDLVCVDVMILEKSLNETGEEVDNVVFDNVGWLQTGVEFLHRLRRGEFTGEHGTPSNVPVLVIPAVAGSSLEPLSQEQIQGYVEKPFRLEELVERMWGLLEE
jgi:CheY-like chemotaxis protein